MIAQARSVPADRSLSLGGVLVLALGALDFGLEQAIVVPALPAFAAHYEASVSDVGWLVTGFLLAGIVAIPLLGRLGDLFGKRRLLLVALGAFATGSLVCALSDSIGVVIAGRIVQGLGMAAGPLIYGIVRDTIPAELLPRAIGTVVGAGSLGVTIGFLASGLFVDHASVTAIFWFLFALAAVLVGGVLLLVPESPVRQEVSVDYLGAALLGTGLAVLLLAISKGNDWGWASGRITALFAWSAASLAVFALVELRVRRPLVDLRLVGTRPFANVNACTIVFAFSFYLASLVIPLIAALPEEPGYGLGYSTTQIGLVLIPTGLAAIAGAWTGGRTVDLVGPRALVASGAVLGIAAYVFLALVDWTTVALTVASGVLGLAWGLVLTGFFPVVIRGSSVDKTSVAVAVNLVVRNTALAVGVQVAFAIVENAGLVGRLPAEAGFTRVFVVGVTGAVVLLLASALMPGRNAARDAVTAARGIAAGPA
jgi:MFS family permease